MMINNDNEYSTNTVMTTESKTIPSNENNSTMSPTGNLSNSNGEEKPVQQTDNESQDNQLVVVSKEEEQQQEEENDDEFIRITAAHQMLTEGKTNKKKSFFDYLKTK